MKTVKTDILGPRNLWCCSLLLRQRTVRGVSQTCLIIPTTCLCRRNLHVDFFRKVLVHSIGIMSVPSWCFCFRSARRTIVHQCVIGIELSRPRFSVQMHLQAASPPRMSLGSTRDHLERPCCGIPTQQDFSTHALSFVANPISLRHPSTPAFFVCRCWS